LTTVPGSSQVAAGDILLLSGRLLYENGTPVDGAVIEIWQTDEKGIYMHPGDPQTGNRDPNFQFYGESIAAADGAYSFRTILPGLYGSRPRHVHFKVKLDGQEVLTSQFYFSGDERIAGNQLPETIVVTTVPGAGQAGEPVLVGRKDVVLAGSRGS
jgi:protocatechuate 3,4-dioxygenase beta subunit